MMFQVAYLSEIQLFRVVTLRPIGVDDIANVRYLHEASFTAFSAEAHTAQETAAFLDMVRRPEYVFEVARCNLVGAYIGGELVGTAGWLAADDRGAAARLRKVFVRPMFGGSGVGRRLVLDAEARAARAGFLEMSVRTNVAAMSFYKRLGYKVTSHGVFATPSGVDLPVTYLRKTTKRPLSGLH